MDGLLDGSAAVEVGTSEVSAGVKRKRSDQPPVGTEVGRDVGTEVETAQSSLGCKPTIARRPDSDSDLSDSTCTPQWLTALLPHRDLDPCSNERAQPIADLRYFLTHGQDGLVLPWMGSAFVNWPFSAPLPFAQKAQHELREGRCTDLIVLCKMDCATRSWREITRLVPGFELDLWMPWKRIQFDEHPELIERRRLERVAKARAAGKPTDRITGASTANFVSVLFHHRKLGTEPWAPFATFAERWTQSSPNGVR